MALINQQLCRDFPHIFNKRILDKSLFIIDNGNNGAIYRDIYISPVVLTFKYYYKYDYLSLLIHLQEYLNKYYFHSYRVYDLTKFKKTP